MISKEEMKEALRVGDDRTVIEYIEQLEKSDASKEQSSMDYYNENKALKQDLDEAWEEWNNLNEYHCQEMEKKCKEIKELKEDKQKLIDKVEEYVNNTKKEKLPYFKTVADMIRYKGYAEGRIKACEEILSIVKGEKQ